MTNQLSLFKNGQRFFQKGSESNIQSVLRPSFLYQLRCVHYRYLQFIVDSERNIFQKLLMAILLLLSEFLPEIYWKAVAKQIFSHKPVHYLIDYGESNIDFLFKDFSRFNLYMSCKSKHEKWESFSNIKDFGSWCIPTILKTFYTYIHT